jgi:cytochrome c oxidase cbb3-type subunit 4
VRQRQGNGGRRNLSRSVRPGSQALLDVWLRNGNDMNLTIYHFVLIIAFIGIVLWVFARKRKARFERDARIPFEEDKD